MSYVYAGGSGSGGITPAPSNLTFYVATTGSDSNSGTSSGSPFLTIQHAVNVAAQYNYQNLYFPTVNVANGTYTNTQVLMPQLTNCPNGGVLIGNTTTPSSCKVADGGTNYTFSSTPQCNWTIEGFQFTGTYGGIYCANAGTIFTLANLDFAGALAQIGIFSFGGTVSAFSTSLSTSASTMGTFIEAIGAGGVGLDGTTITFTNAITFSKFLVWLDAQSLLAFDGGANFVNHTNVTTTLTSCLLTNGGFFEAGSDSFSDGVVLCRANFPGGTFNVDPTSVFQPDGNTAAGTRVLATALTNFYVNNSTGSDSFPGTSALPFATLQHAYNYVSGSFDAAIYDININLYASGTPYTLSITTPLLGGTGALSIKGAGSASTTIDSFSVGNGVSIGTGISIDSVTLTGSTSGSALTHGGIGLVNVGLNSSGDVIVGQAATHGFFVTGSGASLAIFGCTITNTNAGSLFYSEANANLSLIPIFAIQWSGSGWTYTYTAFATLGALINIVFGSLTGSPSVTAQRYLANYGGVIAGTSSATFFPGNVAGVADTNTGGVYGSGAGGISVTITTAKLTSVTGTNGSMTFVDGILTAQTQAT